MWGRHIYICFLLVKILLSIIFSFLTSWEDKRKRRNGCTVDVLKKKRFAGKMPEPERRKQWQHRDTQKLHRVRFCKLWLGDLGWATSLLTALVFSSKISHKSTVVRMDEKLHAKQLAGGLAHTLNKGSNYCYCFIIINKDNSCQNQKHTQPKQGRGSLWHLLQWKGDFVNQVSSRWRLYEMQFGNCLCLVWFKSY